MGSIVRCSFPVIEGAARHVCIIAIKDNKMGAIHTCIYPLVEKGAFVPVRKGL